MTLVSTAARGGGTTFNGGTITRALAVNPTDPSVVDMFTVQAPAGAEANGDLLMRLNSDIAAHLWVDTDLAMFLSNTSVGGLASAQLTDTVGTLILSSASAASPLRLSVTGPGNVFRVLAAGGVVTAQHAAPADADIVAGECALWFDQTNGVGATKLMVKGKSADGTVKTATIVLA